MYLEFYNLTEKPFGLTPDSHFLYKSREYQEAVAHLLYGIQEKKGFILLTGEIGAGKTTLCRTLIKRLEPDYKIAVILNPILSSFGLLKAIVDDLKIPCKSRTKQGIIESLNEFILKGNEIVVIIDEAQNLRASTLEQIRLLGNIETEKTKLVQLILVGQPELQKLLMKEQLRQLRQRIAVSYHIRPLDKTETEGYIYHRLNIAGAQNKIWFQPDAMDEIFNYSQGIPRVINIICDYCLIIGYNRETRVISKDMVQESLNEYHGITDKKMVPA